MDLETLRKRVFSDISYVDSSGDPLADKDISEDDVDNWINDRYLEELFPEYARLKPEFYSQESKAANYQATGTVHATSTSTTLDATTAIFTSNMVDGIVYSSTSDESRKITAYTDTTTVTVDSAIDDDWDGDTIYVFTGIVTLGGNATDTDRIYWVGIKYDSDDEDYTRCISREDRDMYRRKRGREWSGRFSRTAPEYSFDTVDVSGVPTSAIVIRPFDWEAADTTAIYIKYTEKPAALSSDTDVPRLPIAHHKILVYGAVADAYLEMENAGMADKFEGKYKEAFRRLSRSHPAERKKRQINFMRRHNRLFSRT